MEWTPLLYASLYFLIGWFLSDLLGDGQDASTMFIFMFWPLIVALLVLMFIFVICMFIVCVPIAVIKNIKKRRDA